MNKGSRKGHINLMPGTAWAQGPLGPRAQVNVRGVKTILGRWWRSSVKRKKLAGVAAIIPINTKQVHTCWSTGLGTIQRSMRKFKLARVLGGGEGEGRVAAGTMSKHMFLLHYSFGDPRSTRHSQVMQRASYICMSALVSRWPHGHGPWGSKSIFAEVRAGLGCKCRKHVRTSPRNGL